MRLPSTTVMATRRQSSMWSKSAEGLAVLLNERGSLSNSEVHTATGLDPATIRTHLQALVASGYAPTKGQPRGMRYLAV